MLFGLFILLKAVAYWFDRYGLVHSERGVTTGASYTDVNALLPAKTILFVIALLCAVMFFSNLLRRGMMLPGVGFTLLVLSAILLGGVYPLLIQQFQVKPDELAKERQFIQRNIKFTREAYGVDGAKVVPYGNEPVTDKKKLQDDADQLTNGGVRVLDPNVVGETFQQLQRIRPFYQFPDTLDVDRYQVDGKLVDTVVALRELSGAPEGSAAGSRTTWSTRTATASCRPTATGSTRGSPTSSPATCGVPEPADQGGAAGDLLRGALAVVLGGRRARPAGAELPRQQRVGAAEQHL